MFFVKHDQECWHHLFQKKIFFILAVIGLAVILYWIELSCFSFSRNTGYLADYRRISGPISIAKHLNQSSGLAFNSDLNQLYVITNSPAQIHVLSAQGKHIRKVDLLGFYDTEGITYLGHEKFAIVAEKTGSVSWFTLNSNIKSITFDPEKTTTILSHPAGNVGLEGISYLPNLRQLILVKERKPKKIFSLQWPIKDISHPIFKVPWDAEAEWLVRSFSGITYHQLTGHLFILSRRSSSITEYTLSGQKIGSFSLKSNFSQLQDDIKKAEGIVIAPNGTLYVCGESNQLYIFKNKL